MSFDPRRPVSSIRDAARRRGIYLLPNLFTTAALFAGFYAVVAAMDGNFVQAAIAIFVAMILDGMDGRIARLTSTESDFGMEYDSLSDMVSFGLAPALVVYQWGVARLQEYGWIWGKIGWLVAFLYAVAAALRLARFNARISVADKRFFEGLPSPSAAGVVSGLVWLGTELGLTGLPALVLGFVVTAAAGTLMVSSFKYYSFKEWNLGGRIPFTYLLLVPLVFILIAANPPVVLFLLFASYASTGPALALLRLRRRSRRHSDGDVTGSGPGTGTGTEG
jgi:CDP-diacylglycerol--serine O-phosphatidyltransferase